MSNEEIDFDFLKDIPPKKLIGGIFLGTGLLLSVLFFAGQEKTEDTITQAFSIGLSEEDVLDSENRERAIFHLQSLRMQSGIVQELANHFRGAAQNFSNEQGHPCFGKDLVSCLRSFQKTREEEILAYETSSDIGSYEKLKEIQRLTLELLSIEVAIIQVQETNDVVDKKFVDSMAPKGDVKSPPTISFLDSFSSYRKVQELNQRRREEKIREMVESDGCREVGCL